MIKFLTYVAISSMVSVGLINSKSFIDVMSRPKNK